MTRRPAVRLLSGIIIAGALVLAVLGQRVAAPSSPMAWLQFPLLALLAWGLFTNAGVGEARAGFLRIVGLSWILGMLVELTLTVDGTGIGGVHRDTLASFVLAQGDYIPMAIAMWGFHRRLGCGFGELFWITVGASLTEGLIFTGSVTSALQDGAPVGAILAACYLFAIYMVYLLLPFRLASVGDREGGRSGVALLALGFAAAFAIRVFWGLAYAPVASTLLGLDP